jgi:hypothetical protein
MEERSNERQNSGACHHKEGMRPSRIGYDQWEGPKIAAERHI